jgi:uncharacterized membrane protein
MRFYLSSRLRLGIALACSSLVSLSLYAIAASENGDMAYTYLLWNLGLAWIPLVLILWLERVLRTRLWSSWLPLFLTIIWLSFLPNSFYMITDFIHLNEAARANILFDVVMFTSFILNGIILGYLSVYIVHQELLKRLSKRMSAGLVAGVLLLSSFAIYIGRDLRWNTWDVLLNPASVIFDVSDRILNPAAHPQVISTTLSFFVLLTSVYAVVWHVMRASKAVKP